MAISLQINAKNLPNHGRALYSGFALSAIPKAIAIPKTRTVVITMQYIRIADKNRRPGRHKWQSWQPATSNKGARPRLMGAQPSEKKPAHARRKNV
jgi:hypothetical protein